MLQSLPPIISFFSNKIQSTDLDFDEYLIDVANIFAEFDGQIYDYEAVTDRFRQLSDRPIDKARDPSDFRDEYGAYRNFLGIMKVIYENDKWVWRLSTAASKLLCGDEPNVRAFLRVQLSLLQYPLLTGVRYSSQSLSIQSNAMASMKKMIEAKVKVVPLRLILKSLKVKAEIENSKLSETFLSYKEILFLFNNPITSTDSNPSSEKITEVLDFTKRTPILVDERIFRNFYRNFHILERTGIISRSDNGVMINLNEDIETSASKQKMIDVITKMTSFCEDFYQVDSCKDIVNHLRSMASESVWSKYYDGGQLPQDIYSTLVLELSRDTDISIEEVEFMDISQIPVKISSDLVSTPPLVNRISSNYPSRLYRSANSNADPEVTRLKREKSNTYHRFLVNLMTSRLQSIGCEPQESIYIDLAAKIENSSILFEVKSCNAENTVSQIRKAVSQVYEYRYRYCSDFPDNSSLLCIVIQERPNQWWINYLIDDRGINVIWLEGEINLACTSSCHELIKRLVDRIEQ
jgi:hypothetical protein